MVVPFYDVYVAQEEQMLQFIESYPPEFLAFFGGMAAINTPAGFLNSQLTTLPVVFGIFAVLAGSALLARDEESGRLDLILAHPVSRLALFGGRLAAFVAANIAILTVCWLGFCIPLSGSSMDVSWGQMALPFVSTFAVVLVFGTIALLLSMVLSSRRRAAAAAGAVMVAGFFLSGMANLNADLKPIARALPYEYFQGGYAISGLNLVWFGGLMAVSALFAALAGWRFQRRDIRVGGEGNLGLARPAFLSRLRRASL
ncbi:MAG: ABC transporter permease subunit [Rhodothermaceae bacterium]|nr:ABC transporter permease subunit [Rhodothermaceae bacterium]